MRLPNTYWRKTWEGKTDTFFTRVSKFYTNRKLTLAELIEGFKDTPNIKISNNASNALDSSMK